MRSALLITLITCLTSIFAFSQPITTANYETMVATAEEAYANQDYYNALKWYEDAYEEKKDRELPWLLSPFGFPMVLFSSSMRQLV